MSDVDPHLSASVSRKIAELERRLRVMENSNRLTNASIQEGALLALDATGTTRVIFGLNPETNEYGLAVLAADGSFVLDNTVMGSTFGPSSATVLTNETRTLATYGDLATPGPAVTVEVSRTGNLLVVAGSDVAVLGATTITGKVSFALSGANTLAAQDANAAQVLTVLPAAATILVSTAVVRLLTGLNAGVTTITAKYAADGTHSTAFAERNVFAIPI